MHTWLEFMISMNGICINDHDQDSSLVFYHDHSPHRAISFTHAASIIITYV